MTAGRRSHGAVLFACILALGPGAVGAQTILNTERFQVDEGDGFHMSADLSFSMERGNSDVLNASASGIVGTVAATHWPRIIFGGRYLSDDESSILDDQFLQLRYSWLFSPRARTFHFVQVQHNETLLLERRWLVGTGARFEIHSGERGSIALGTGVMGEWERLAPERLGPTDERRPRALRMANVGVASWEFEGGATILNIVYLQPRLTDLRDVRVLYDLGLAVPITEHLGTTIALEWRSDSRPPTPLGPNDLTLRAGFSIDLP